MCLEGVRRLGPHQHPEITLTGVAMYHMLDAWERGDLAELRAMFMKDMAKLEAAGADFFVCPDNTAHIALESTGEARSHLSPGQAASDAFPMPCLHIGEVVAEQAQRDGRTKVGILGTKWTMTGPVYPSAFGRRGIGWAVPDEADRKILDDIIFDELCLGVFRDQSRDAYVRVIEKLADQGCDAVALVCTEIPLLITQEVSPLPILDSTRLLAAAAVEVAIGERPMPEWRGGPVE
jgi:aspartate racemase